MPWLLLSFWRPIPGWSVSSSQVKPLILTAQILLNIFFRNMSTEPYCKTAIYMWGYCLVSWCIEGKKTTMFYTLQFCTQSGYFHLKVVTGGGVILCKASSPKMTWLTSKSFIFSQEACCRKGINLSSALYDLQDFLHH